MIPELFILGIDGLGGDIVLGTDLLPNLKKSCLSHEHAIVESPNNLVRKDYPYPHTWPAWTTIWTGQPEEKHGIQMPDYKNDIVQNITDQPYITIWEILDSVNYKIGMLNQQMMKGIEFKHGENHFGVSAGDIDFFTLNSITKNHLTKLTELGKKNSIIGYYTIALDNWFHQSMQINKEMMFYWVDYLIQWCQFFCPAKDFIILSDHGFNPDTGKHTNSAFYFSRRVGQKLEGIHLVDIAEIILSHFGGELVEHLGDTIDRDPFKFSEKENRDIMNQFQKMGYL